MKIEPRTLKVIKKYLLKKHTPMLDFESGSVWVPSRPQDGLDFIARFGAPDLRSGVEGDMLAVCPDIIQSELTFERIDGGVFLKGKNGAHYKIAKTRLCCVGESEGNRTWTLVSRAKRGGLMPANTRISEGQLRAVQMIAARFKKVSNLPETNLRYSWYRHDGRLEYQLWKADGNPGYCSLRIWLD